MRANPLLAVPAIIPDATPLPIAPTPIPPDATEEQLIRLWLRAKSPNTIRAYRRDVAAFIGKPIRLAYLATSTLRRCAHGIAGIVPPQAARG